MEPTNQLDSDRILNEVFAIIVQNVFPSQQDIDAAYHRATTAISHDIGAFDTHKEGVRYRYQDDWPSFVLTLRLTCCLGRQITAPLFVPLMMIRKCNSFCLERAYVAGLVPGQRLLIDAAISFSVPGLLLARRLFAHRGVNMYHGLLQAIRIMFLNRWYKGLMWLVNFEPQIATLDPSIFGFEYTSWDEAVNALMWD